MAQPVTLFPDQEIPYAAGADHNTFSLGDLKFSALGDRIIIQEDEFRTGYECTVCGGSGKMPCDTCTGTGKSKRTPNARCVQCEGTGSVPCMECKGKGGLIIAPDIAARRPTSGKIVSCGPKCVDLKLGECVLYSNFAGYTIDLDRAGHKITLRILHESEILCRVEGHLELRTLRGKSELAVFNG